MTLQLRLRTTVLKTWPSSLNHLLMNPRNWSLRTSRNFLKRKATSFRSRGVIFECRKNLSFTVSLSETTALLGDGTEWRQTFLLLHVCLWLFLVVRRPVLGPAITLGHGRGTRIAAPIICLFWREGGRTRRTFLSARKHYLLTWTNTAICRSMPHKVFRNMFFLYNLRRHHHNFVEETFHYEAICLLWTRFAVVVFNAFPLKLNAKKEFKTLLVTSRQRTPSNHEWFSC